MQAGTPITAFEHLRESVREYILTRAGLENSDLHEQEMKGTLPPLRGLLPMLKISYSAVGSMPPQPPGFRARCGAFLVGLVRRMLFWYTPQIVRFQSAVTELMEEQVRAIEALSHSLDRTMEEVERLRLRIEQLEARSRGAPEAQETSEENSSPLDSQAIARTAGEGRI